MCKSNVTAHTTYVPDNPLCHCLVALSTYCFPFSLQLFMLHASVTENNKSHLSYLCFIWKFKFVNSSFYYNINSFASVISKQPAYNSSLLARHVRRCGAGAATVAPLSADRALTHLITYNIKYNVQITSGHATPHYCYRCVRVDTRFTPDKLRISKYYIIVTKYRQESRCRD